MNLPKLIGMILIAAGALGLFYGGFSYTKDTHSARLGPFLLQVQEKQTVLVPMVVSAASLALGLFLLIGIKSK